MAGPEIAALENVSKSYGRRAVLANFAIALRAGEVTALLGPNGAGKSTAAGLLIGRLSADSGTVRLFGRDPRDRGARARLGVMLQGAGVPEALSVFEAVSLQAGYFAPRRRTRDILEDAGLGALAARRCDTLSGGEQRRVQFALAIAGNPDLLVLDEPTTGFDAQARRALWRTVRAKADGGTGVLLATHHMDEADALADRIVVIAGGRIVADGPPAAIRQRVAGTAIRARTEITPARLASLPGVMSAEPSGADMVILTNQPRATLLALFDADPALEAFTVGSASLEDAIARIVTASAEAA